MLWSEKAAALIVAFVRAAMRAARSVRVLGSSRVDHLANDSQMAQVKLLQWARTRTSNGRITPSTPGGVARRCRRRVSIATRSLGQSGSAAMSGAERPLGVFLATSTGANRLRGTLKRHEGSHARGSFAHQWLTCLRTAATWTRPGSAYGN